MDVLATILQRMTAGMVSRSAVDCGSSKGMSTAVTTVNIPGCLSGYSLSTSMSFGLKTMFAITFVRLDAVLPFRLEDKRKDYMLIQRNIQST